MVQKCCSECGTMIPVVAIRCPNCTSYIGSAGGSISFFGDIVTGAFVFSLMAGMLYFIFSKA